MSETVHNQYSIFNYDASKQSSLTVKRLFTCEQCHKSFNRKDHLKRHIGTHSGEKPFGCAKCQKAFSDSTALIKHLGSHTNVRPFRCVECHKGFNSKHHLKRHSVSHTGERPFACGQCQMSYSRQDQLKRHLRRHFQEAFKKQALTSADLTLHNVEERKILATANGALIASHEVITFRNERAFVCEQCQKRFNRKDHLKRHLGTHTGHRPFSCDQCEKAFLSKEALIKHTGTHSGVRPFVCEQCQKSYNGKYQLRRHMKSHEEQKNFPKNNGFIAGHPKKKTKLVVTGERPFKCEQCHKGFNRQDHLRRHLETHTAVKSFSCQQCPMSYKRQDQLKRHLKRHLEEAFCDQRSIEVYKGEQTVFSENNNLTIQNRDGRRPLSFKNIAVKSAPCKVERPFVCEQCQKRFIRKDHLNRHMKCHTTVKPFECEHCQKRFNREDQLGRHLRSHEEQQNFPKNSVILSASQHHVALLGTGERPFKCEQCNKGFNRKDHYKRHLGTHTGEKPFGCEHCSKRYNDKDHLKRHLKTHTGERPFICVHCAKSYIRKDQLSAHLRNHCQKMIKQNQHGPQPFLGNNVETIVESQLDGESHSKHEQDCQSLAMNNLIQTIPHGDFSHVAKVMFLKSKEIQRSSGDAPDQTVPNKDFTNINEESSVKYEQDFQVISENVPQTVSFENITCIGVERSLKCEQAHQAFSNNDSQAMPTEDFYPFWSRGNHLV